MRARSVRAGHRKEIRRYLKSMSDAGAMRPEWCFVVEEENRPIGRVAFWTLLTMKYPFALVLLGLPWDGDYRATAGACSGRAG